MGIERSEGEKEDKTERKENIKGDWALNDILEMENLLNRFYSITCWNTLLQVFVEVIIIASVLQTNTFEWKQQNNTKEIADSS